MSTGQSHDRLSELFLELVELAPEQRPAALDRACVGAPGLRRRLAAMLEVDEAEDFLPGQALDVLGVDRGALFAEAASSIPESIGRYRVLRLLGEGGMGVVYLAEQETPRRQVAVKVLRHGLVTQDALRRFSVEAEVLGRLAHPGVAQIHEAGVAEIGGQAMPFLVMEYIDDARTLTAFLAQERTGRRDRLALFADICDAVHHGHQKGVVHRDLKPANILVGRDGRAKVIDFGVARVVDDESALSTQLTKSGQLIGTLQYMSPEQCGPDPGAVDTRSDVYALGVILHEMVVGEPPYQLADVPLHEAMTTIRDAPPRVSSLGLGADLTTILRRALEKDPDRRYPSSHSLASDVRRYLSGRTISARPPSLVYQWRSFVRRNKVPVLAGAVVVITALVAAALSTSFWLDSETKNAELAQRVYSQQLRLAADTLQQGDLDRAEELLGDTDADLRGWEWSYLHNIVNANSLEFRAFEGRVTDVETSPGGTEFVVAGMLPGGRGEVAWFDAATGEALRAPLVIDGIVEIGSIDSRQQRALVIRDRHTVELVRLPSGDVHWSHSDTGLEVASVHWNEGADQVVVVFREESSVIILDASSGRLVEQLDDFSDLVIDVEASPSGDLLAVQTLRGVQVVDSADTRRRWRPEQTVDWFFGKCTMAFSPDERSLAVSHDGVLELHQLVEGGTKLIRSLPAPGIAALCWMPDGSGVAVVDSAREVGIMEFPSGGQRAAWIGHRSLPTALDVSSDGRQLAAGTDTGFVRVWPSLPNRGVSYRNTSMISFAIDGANDRIILAGWGDARLIDASTGFSRWTSWVTPQVLSAASVHPEDGTAALADNAGGLHRIDLGSGDVLSQAHASPGIAALAHSPDGEVLVVATIAGSVEALRDDGYESLWSRDGIRPMSRLCLSPLDGRFAFSRSVQGSPLQIETCELETGETLWACAIPGERSSAMSWSPDGARLVVATDDGSLSVLDAESGELLDHIGGAREDITCLAFSPDGSRLLLGGRDGLDVWNVGTWREIVRIVDGTYLLGVAFLPDGERVMTVEIGGRVTVLETNPPATDVLLARERLGQLRVVVDELFRLNHTSRAVVAALEADLELDPAFRAEALDLARSLTDNPNFLNSHAWGLVRVLHGDPSLYDRALAEAEAAVNLRPEVGAYWNTLGLAQLHVGQYEEAIATFERCNRANSGPEGTPGRYSDGVHPLDVLGLSLARHGLEQHDEAMDELERARAIMADRPHVVDNVTKRFERHAVRLIVQDP
jgi:serine/threonine protein kinase/WD40 repeat protein